MNKYETFALSQVFHSYPDNKTFEEICELCKNDEARDNFNESLENTDNECQQLNVCERYETEWWENLPIILKELAENAKYYISGYYISGEEFNCFEIGLLSGLLDKYIKENEYPLLRNKCLELAEKLTRLDPKYYEE